MDRVIERPLITTDTNSIKFLYGLIAEFIEPEEVIAAAKRTRDAGFRRIDAYAPFPVDGLAEALGKTDFYIPLIMLLGGIMGCIGGFSFLYWCTDVSFPLNIAGAPLFGWPSWVPITFEATVLTAALSGLVGLFLLCGLPMPYHPVFEAKNFKRATSDRFFLCIEATDAKFERDETREFMESLGAVNVSEVELEP